ncbi:MAG: phosphoribosylanthranilate isomerase [Candidatus Omnitrophica bacterium]|nr:phosphoribosylanthranilate isomerase [Candidatus Omnitrophota bacterium]
MVRVKICGITNLEDAIAAVAGGCDALGFIFYKKSPRYIKPEIARQIIRLLPRKIIKVGIFVDAKESLIKQIAGKCSLDMLQFHGSESPEFCKKFKKYRVIKSFRVKNKLNQQDLRKYKVFAFLFDSFTLSKPGGTGKKFNWKFIPDISCLNRTVFLAGGLNASNVNKAICAIKPHWVDASTSLEQSPGKKNKRKLIAFIKKAKHHL